ncbi:6535_t:CDS:1 [Funneliformis caledonium]|uniref:6535_t:CDS:1 n=1 Tax=Funneliformis caledonium TaxID=1117310 RepID=A0A9N9ANK6_9GLOM|nr:6535_t:CDS:1 [Funneliformis caledonium]
MKNDEAIRKEYESLNMWLNADVPEKVKNKRLKVNDKDNRAIFKKVRVVQYNISYGTQTQAQTQNSNNIVKEEQAVSTNDKKSQEIDIRNWEVKKKEEEILIHPSFSRISQKFSFSSSKQGSYVESILEHVERALLIPCKHLKYIPFNIVKEFAVKCHPPRNIDFSDADLLCLLNFIIKNVSLFMIPNPDQTLFHGEYKLKPLDILKSFKTEARNHHAHGITQIEGGATKNFKDCRLCH